MTLSLNPAYNLKAVLKETGIKPDVLRAWERRYGIPMPERTSGGHRLYSEHDIQLIKWLISRQHDGLSISRAVEMWKEHLVQGHNPLYETPVAQAEQAGPSGAPGVDAMRSQWLAACINFNEIEAEQVLNQAFAQYPVETVCLQILQRGMVEVGSLWYENRASVQQEHFASALAMRRLDALIAASPAPTRAQTVIIGCPVNEWHAFTPLLITLLLRRRGLNVIYVGANVPLQHFVETVEAVKANLVILASQQLITAASLQQFAAQLSARAIPVAYGGRIFALNSGLRSRIAGHYLGDSLAYVSAQTEMLLASNPGIPQSLLPSDEYVAALQAFGAGRALVEARLNVEISARGGDVAYTMQANKYMGDNIIAALQLGDITCLDGEIDWLDVLLDAQKVARSLVYDYLRSYSTAVSQQLGDQASVITAWLENRIHSGGF